jgi:hypothetical protein
VKVRKVKAYQLTLHPDSGAACNETRFELWKNETGFDEGNFQGAVAFTAIGQPRLDACRRWGGGGHLHS